MVKSYDLVVLGTGVAGGVVARKCNSAGMTVAVADPRPFGGTCPLRGCEPKKVLFDVLEPLIRSRSLQGKGITNTLDVSWTELMNFKSSFTDPVPELVEKGFKESGIDTYHGPGSFLDEETLEVGAEKLKGKYIFIGTGATPRPMDFPGAGHMITSDDFFELTELPKRMVFVGGGYISFEFAHVVARLGVQAEILQRSDRCLKHFDSQVVEYLCSYSSSLGINVHYQSPIYSIQEKEGFLLVRAGKNGEQTFKTDMVVHGAGRVAAIQGMNLEKGDVQFSEQGIDVDEHMQSVTNPRVYSAGDCTSDGEQLTPVALHEARTAATNIIDGNSRKVNRAGFSSVLFTHPSLSGTGFQEEELKRKGIEYTSTFKETSDWSSYKRIGQKPAAMKVLMSKDRTRILGAHILGHNSEEIINVFGMAIRLDIPVSDLKSHICSYPSFIYDALQHML